MSIVYSGDFSKGLLCNVYNQKICLTKRRKCRIIESDMSVAKERRGHSGKSVSIVCGKGI